MKFHSGRIFLLLLLFCLPSARAEKAAERASTKSRATSLPKKEEKSPSFDQKKWTGAQGAFELMAEYNYVGPASQPFGENREGRMQAHYLDVRQQLLRRTLLAFLVQGGFEAHQMYFNPPAAAYIPDQLGAVNAFVAVDFRWSRKDMLRIQSEPGFYSDFGHLNRDAINAPVALAYTRVPSKTFQWVIGFSYNPWREFELLPGGGFRWQLAERWKLKFFMPTPNVEFKARPDLHVFVGADFRGDSYRVSGGFGNARGQPPLNNALVDYQEIRAGPGVSWNILPLLEFNVHAGYMLGREFKYHNNGVTLRSGKAPFINLSMRWLLKLPGEVEQIPARSKIRFRDIFNYL